MLRRLRFTAVLWRKRRKRAYLAGEITQAARQLAGKYTALKNLDATIQLFAPTTNPELIPAIRPTRRGLFFRRGVQMRLCRDALREAGGPLSARQVAEYAMRAKGLPVGNAPILSSITVQVRVALGRLEAKGVVVKIISAPDAWWALAKE
jgi:hypothetical protein